MNLARLNSSLAQVPIDDGCLVGLARISALSETLQQAELPPVLRGKSRAEDPRVIIQALENNGVVRALTSFRADSSSIIHANTALATAGLLTALKNVFNVGPNFLIDSGSYIESKVRAAITPSVSHLFSQPLPSDAQLTKLNNLAGVLRMVVPSKLGTAPIPLGVRVKEILDQMRTRGKSWAGLEPQHVSIFDKLRDFNTLAGSSSMPPLVIGPRSRSHKPTQAQVHLPPVTSILNLDCERLSAKLGLPSARQLPSWISLLAGVRSIHTSTGLNLLSDPGRSIPDFGRMKQIQPAAACLELKRSPVDAKIVQGILNRNAMLGALSSFRTAGGEDLLHPEAGMHLQARISQLGRSQAQTASSPPVNQIGKLSDLAQMATLVQTLQGVQALLL